MDAKQKQFKARQSSNYAAAVSSFKAELKTVKEIIAKKHNIPECPICMEYVLTDVKIIRCGHIFHNKCVKNQEICPVCRTSKNPKPQPVNNTTTYRLNPNYIALDFEYACLINSYMN